jgi:tRNA threonylcarbamoyladenosine biosynthesis protein TsaE
VSIPLGTFTTHSQTETEELAAKVAADLKPGMAVLLSGDLGVGKTAFVRGLARGLAIDPDLVSSPTFVLLQEYRGRLTLYHADLYRLQAEEDVAELGLEDVAAGGVVAVEWAERLPTPPSGAIRVAFDDLGGDDRRITIAVGDR